MTNCVKTLISFLHVIGVGWGLRGGEERVGGTVMKDNYCNILLTNLNFSAFKSNSVSFVYK